MNRKAILSCAAVFLLGVSSVCAQMRFAKTVHDFGKVAEEAGDVAYTFEFVNEGKTPVILTDVKASCGCTTPEWTKQPVLPGKTGTVKATFDPKNRPGIFDKEITVQAQAQQVTLKITGEVTPKPKGVAELYPIQMGSLRLKSNNLPFANIYHNAQAKNLLPVINVGNTDLKISFENAPAHLKFSVEPELLKPNETGVITCEYNAAAKNDWGYVSEKVKILLNEKADGKNEITVSASIDENFVALSSEDKVNAPVLKLSTRAIALGNVKFGKSEAFSIPVANSGKTALTVRKVTSNCNCIAFSEGNPKEIAAGQTATIKAVFNADQKGKISKTITLITNAPATPNVTVRLSATVE